MLMKYKDALAVRAIVDQRASEASATAASIVATPIHNRATATAQEIELACDIIIDKLNALDDVLAAASWLSIALLKAEARAGIAEHSIERLGIDRSIEIWSTLAGRYNDRKRLPEKLADEAEATLRWHRHCLADLEVRVAGAFDHLGVEITDEQYEYLVEAGFTKDRRGWYVEGAD